MQRPRDESDDPLRADTRKELTWQRKEEDIVSVRFRGIVPPMV